MNSIYWLATIFLGLVSLTEAQNCPDVYKRYSARHTGCLATNYSCDALKSGVTEQDKQTILRLHNEYRNKVASGQETRAGLSPAANMLELVWDDELASVAQKLTDSCRYGHDCKPCRQVARFLVGQNLARENGIPATKNYADWKWMVDALYNEIDYFDKEIIKKYEDRPVQKKYQYGHLTQILWADSWRIGCGWTHYQEPISGTSYTIKRSYYACNFGPRGNIVDQRVYKEGPTCSACPANTCCGQSCARYGVTSTYRGLCKVINENLPPEGNAPTVTNAPFYCGFQNEPDCAGLPSNWKIMNSHGDNYAEIVLNGGQSAAVTFNKRFRSPTGTMCFHMLMRRAPNRDGDAYASSYTGKLIVNGNVFRELDTRQMPQQAWHMFVHSQYPIGVPENQDIQYGLTFSVPPGSMPQYINIKKIYFEEGMCNW